MVRRGSRYVNCLYAVPRLAARRIDRVPSTSRRAIRLSKRSLDIREANAARDKSSTERDEGTVHKHSSGPRLKRSTFMHRRTQAGETSRAIQGASSMQHQSICQKP